jgi:hypothetical protein
LESQTKRSWRLVDLALEGIAQQMLDLQKKNLQKEVQGMTDRASSNLTADNPSVFRP